MAYYDLDRRRDGTLSPLTGSFDPTGLIYQAFAVHDAETRVQFPYDSLWIQITATTSDAVKYSFKFGGTGGTAYNVVPGNTQSPVLPIRSGEIYVLNDAAITVCCSNTLSGSQGFNTDRVYNI